MRAAGSNGRKGRMREREGKRWVPSAQLYDDSYLIYFAKLINKMYKISLIDTIYIRIALMSSQRCSSDQLSWN